MSYVVFLEPHVSYTLGIIGNIVNSCPELVKVIKTYTSYLVRSQRISPVVSISSWPVRGSVLQLYFCDGSLLVLRATARLGRLLVTGLCPIKVGTGNWSLVHGIDHNFESGAWIILIKQSQPLGPTHHLPNSRLAAVSIPLRRGIISGFSAINGENGR